MHWRNAAERAVSKFNNYFIYILYTLYTHFPFYLFHCLFPQVTITLNMMRKSQLNPGILAYKQVNRVKHFEHTPLISLGCKVKIYDKPHQRCTYSLQSVDVWYVGPAVNNYRCYTCYNIYTGVENTPDTIAFFPAFMKMPNFSSRYMDINSSVYLEKALQTPHLESTFKVGDSQLKAIS